MVDTETTPIRGWSGAGGGRGIQDVKQHPSPSSSPKQPSPSCTSSPSSQDTLASTTTACTTTIASAPATTKLGATTRVRRTPKREPLDVSLPASTSRSTSITTPAGSAMSTMLKEGTTPTQRISRAKKGKRVHACNYPGCEKIFTRAEHLRRHQLNHTPETVHKCEMCERTFVRQDLLTRHTERHATQARKAVQTLAMTQRHRQFSSHFGINGITVLAAPPPPDYGGNAHLFDASTYPTPRVPSHNQDANLSQILNVHSSHQSSPASSIVSSHSTTSMAGYAPGYPAPISIPISQPPEAVPGFTPAEPTAPSTAGLQRAHLPFHLQHNEPQRQPEQYMIPVTSHPDVLRRSLTVAVDPQQHQTPQLPQQQQHIYTPRSWDNYDWLFDTSLPDQVVMMEMNQNTHLYLNELEAQYYGGIAEGAANKDRGSQPVFHPMDESMRSQILLLVGDTPNIHSGDIGLAALQQYLRLYWTEFHPAFPLLHMPTFVPSIQRVMLVAIVLAIGASYADAESGHFAMAVYDKVKGWILNSEEFSTHNPSVITQQLILLTDVFGKMRSTRSHLEGSQLELILMNNLRRSQILNNDPMQNVKRYLRQGLEFDYQSEWQTWIDQESKKRVALFSFYWNAQQAMLFGRDMCQTVFDVRLQLPCEEYMWHANTPGEWIDKVAGAEEGQGFLENIKIFLDFRRAPPTLTPFSLVLVLHGLVAIGLDLQRRSSPITTDANDSAAKQAKVARGLEIWRGKFDDTMPQMLVQSWYQKGLLMYHMSNIALHTDRANLFAAAGDRRFFRRNSNAFYMATQELQQWISGPSAQLATWHSVQILLRYLNDSQIYHQDLYVTWSAYMATLICWAYGQTEVVVPEGPVWDLEQDMRVYLQQMNTDTWQSLGHVGRQSRRQTAGLLAVMRDTMNPTRWGSVQEGLEVLKRLGMQRDMKSV